MNVSIIGAGNVGMALATALTRAGQAVTLGVPDPSKRQTSVDELGAAARLTTTADAIAAGDVVIVAVPYAAGARVVKAFNTTGAENMADSRYPQGKPMMPVAAGDARARQQVMALATLIGFDAVDVGPLRAARWLEPMAMAWIHLALVQGQGRRFAFARLHRE